MTKHVDTTLGDLVAEFYDAFIEAYGDEEVARVGTAMLLNQLLRGVVTS